MNKTHVCPKCQHREILFVPQLADRDDGDAVRPIVVQVIPSDWREDAEYGRIQAYICTGCGFTELYTTSVKDIPLAKVPGARLLKG